MENATVRALTLLLTAQFFACTAALAQSAPQKRYALPERGALQMNVPAGWKDEVQSPQQKDLPPTISFSPVQGQPFAVLVTPIWRARADIPEPTRETILKQVQGLIEGTRSQAVEKDVKPLEIKGASGPGYYYSVTDRAPKPGEFKHMTQGMVKAGELLVTFTILTNDGQQDVAQAALAMLRGAAQVKQ
jgi:hypothetical protein